MYNKSCAVLRLMDRQGITTQNHKPWNNQITINCTGNGPSTFSIISKAHQEDRFTYIRYLLEIWANTHTPSHLLSSPCGLLPTQLSVEIIRNVYPLRIFKVPAKFYVDRPVDVRLPVSKTLSRGVPTSKSSSHTHTPSATAAVPGWSVTPELASLL